MYIGITLLFGFAAVNTGNNLIFLIEAALLAFMSVSGFLGWVNIRGLTVRISIPDEIYCDIETLVTIHLTNRKSRFPSFLLKVRVLGETVPFDLLARHEEQKNSFLYKFRKRGEYSIAAGEISSPFPINFFVRSRWVAAVRHVVVFPTPVACSMPVSCNQTETYGSASDLSKGYEGDVAKINDYSGFEPLRLIHWRLSARHENLKVKELSATAREPVILQLASLPGAHLEEKLSSAVYLVNRLIGKNTEVGLRLKDRLIPPAATRGHRLQLLSELALYDQD